MYKLLIFTIFLATSSTLGLVGNLLQAENDCYSGCHSNYVDHLSNLDACQRGCDYKLHNEQCADQCKLLSVGEQIQASCLVGCSMNHPEIQPSAEKHRPQSIFLIRLRSQPSAHLSSSNSDPIETFNDIIKQFKENKELIGQSNDGKSAIDSIKILQSSNSMFHREEKINSLQKFIQSIRNKWHELLCQQPKLSIWIILSLFILSSTILWYMIVSLCCHTSKHHNLSIRAEDLILEKEMIPPVTPIKIKLINI